MNRTDEMAMSWETCNCDLTPWQRRADLFVRELREDVRRARTAATEGRMEQRTVDDIDRMSALIVLAIRWLDADGPEGEIREKVKEIVSEL